MRQVLRAGALGRPRGLGWGGRWEGCSGWGTHVNPWLIDVNVWQNPLQYCKVISLQLIKKKSPVWWLYFASPILYFRGFLQWALRSPYWASKLKWQGTDTRAQFSSVQSFSRVRLRNPTDWRMPGLPVHHQLLELTQTHVHCVGDIR